MSGVVLEAQDVGRKWWDQEQKGRDSGSLRPGGWQGSKIWTAARTNAEPFGKPFRGLVKKLESKGVKEGTKNVRPPGELFAMGG